MTRFLPRHRSGAAAIYGRLRTYLDRVGPDGFHVAAGFSGHGFNLSPAVGHMMTTLILEGPRGHPDLPTFRLSRFAEGKPIRGTRIHAPRLL